MSEDPTKFTLETIAKQLNDLSMKVRVGFASTGKRLSTVEYQLEQMDIRLDTIESYTLQTRSEVLALRASFKTTRVQGSSTVETVRQRTKDKKRA
jgi:hypothetical protein